jgi:hypothetical protein
MKQQLDDVGFEVFVVVKIQVKVFWDVMPHGVVVGYQWFGEPCCPHIQGKVTGDGKKVHFRPTSVPSIPITSHFDLKMKAGWSSETLVYYHNTT